MRQIRLSSSMSGRWKRGMAMIMWHRWETKRQTENTNFGLNYRAISRLYSIAFGIKNIGSETTRKKNRIEKAQKTARFDEVILVRVLS